MTLSTKKITKSLLQNITEGDRVRDTEVTGLVARKGKKKVTFSFYYKFQGQTKTLRIGDYGGLTITDARDAAIRHRQNLLKGIDPKLDAEKKAKDFQEQIKAEEAEAKRRAYSLADAFKDWQEHFKSRVSKGHVADIESFYKNWMEAIASKPMKDITKEDVSCILNAMIGADKSPHTIAACFKNLRRLWNISGPNELARHNLPYPAKGLVLPKKKSRSRFVQLNEFKAFTRALDEYKNFGDLQARAVRAIKVILLSGARKNECLSIEIRNIDLLNNRLNFIDTKNGNDHSLPLSPELKEIIIEQMKTVPPSSSWLFPSDKIFGAPLRGIKKHWEAIREMAKLKDIRLHDMRRTYASIARLSQVQMSEISELLNHQDISTTKIYARLFDESKTHAALTTASTMGALLDPAKVDDTVSSLLDSMSSHESTAIN